MADPARIGVGILGLGVVGTGIVNILGDRRDYFQTARGIDIELCAAAVREVGRKRSVNLPADRITDSPQSVIDHPDVSLVVEVMGGIEPARSLCLASLEAGKDVVTANKALLAEHGNELFAAAAANNAGLAFEASVCGGIPIIRAVAQGLLANRIHSLYGILNGTTNYILTRMSDAGGAFEEILSEAQQKGYAEADPTMDVDGTDAVQKLAILCRLAFGVSIPYCRIPREGITHIAAEDIAYARELGYAIKLLGIAREASGRVEARVHPALVPANCLLANIKDEFNAVEIVGSATGPQVYSGRGAGSLPTASAIVSDLIDQAERRLSGHPAVSRHLVDAPAHEPVPAGETRSSFYCRFTVDDAPGVLAEIARIFSERGISIATVIQQGRSQIEGGAVPLIMTTHEAAVSAMNEAIGTIGGLDVVREKPQLIRIESLG